MVELTPTEKLVIAQAFQKSVGELTKTKDPYNLRGEVDAFYKEEYAKTGAKSFDVQLLGKNVGTYSITVEKPTESYEKTEIEVDDDTAFADWAMANGFASVKVDMKAVESYFAETGEVPDGAHVISVTVPGVEGGRVKSTTLRVDSEKVARVLGPQLEPIAYALLEGE